MLECVVNVSEGRRGEVIEALATAAGAVGTGVAAARLGGSGSSSAGRRGDGLAPASTPGSLVKDVAARLVLPVFIVLLAMLLAWVNQEAAAIYVPDFLTDSGLMAWTHAAGRAVLMTTSGIPVLSTVGSSVARQQLLPSRDVQATPHPRLPWRVER